MKSRIPRRRPRSKMLELKMEYTDHLVGVYDSKINNLQTQWKQLLNKVNTQISDMNTTYDSARSSLEFMKVDLESKSKQLNMDNDSLWKKINYLKKDGENIVSRQEELQMKIKSEEDLIVELNERKNELLKLKQSLDMKLSKKKQSVTRYKKDLLRVMSQLKKYEKQKEEEEIKKHVKAKRNELKAIQKKEEEEKARQEAIKNDPMTAYKQLLERAGYVVNDDKYKYEKYDESLPILQQNTRRLVVDTHSAPPDSFAKRRLTELLATGNYTEDDPVIRSLRKQLSNEE